MEIRTCKECGFILGTRPNMQDRGGVCLSCLNKGNKEKINWEERQEWLTKYIAENKNPNTKWECVVGVSGGKDSCTIVKRLIENHGVKHPLLVNVGTEFRLSKAGIHNLDNLVKTYNLDLIKFRCEPKTFIERTKKDFFEICHPLKWIEEQLYNIPMDIADAFKIPIVFMGENSAFEYGETEECEIFHPASNDNRKVIFMGSIYPYSSIDSLQEALKIGFKTLDDFDDWQRQGNIDNFTQIDSIGYIVHLWCKFLKFGFQRVSDMACRFVREGIMTKEQAEQMIKDKDYILDPLTRKDFCKTLGITNEEFQNTVDKFANRDLLIKDVNGNWRRKDLI